MRCIEIVFCCFVLFLSLFFEKQLFYSCYFNRVWDELVGESFEESRSIKMSYLSGYIADGLAVLPFLVLIWNLMDFDLTNPRLLEFTLDIVVICEFSLLLA